MSTTNVPDWVYGAASTRMGEDHPMRWSSTFVIRAQDGRILATLEDDCRPHEGRVMAAAPAMLAVLKRVAAQNLPEDIAAEIFVTIAKAERSASV